jgi:hypothetical protein
MDRSGSSRTRFDGIPVEENDPVVETRSIRKAGLWRQLFL